MDAALINGYLAKANSDRDFFKALSENPADAIAGYEKIQEKVAQSLAGISADVAMDELLKSSSNDRCPTSSCGIGSIISSD